MLLVFSFLSRLSLAALALGVDALLSALLPAAVLPLINLRTIATI